MTPQDPGVYISSAQMYQEMRALHDALTRIDVKLDGLRERDADADVTLTDHESRLRVLERGRWPLPALAIVVSVAAVVLGLLPR